MLTYLKIKNFTLIEKLELNLSQGLTVFTGETGAGKSILLDALMLLLGGRADTDLIREGFNDLEISARFDLSGEILQNALPLLEEQGIECEDGALILRRVIAHNGKHRQWINGFMATVNQLRQIVLPLVDFTGQHAQLSLLRPKGQLDLLDAFAHHPHLLLAMRNTFEGWTKTRRSLAALVEKQAQRESQLEWLRFQVEQFDRIAPGQDEYEGLLAEREKLSSFGKIKQALVGAQYELGDGERGFEVLAQVQRASHLLLQLAAIDERWAQLGQSLVDAAAIVDDVSRELDRALERTEADPERLEKIEDRLDELKQLMRKHGPTMPEALAKHAQMKSELYALAQVQDELADLQRKEESAHVHCQEAAKSLSQSRQLAAERFSKLIAQEMADLGLPLATIQVAVVTASMEKEGSDCVQILFSANPGEPPQPLEKVASGGELSRVLLGVKRILLQKDRTLVSVFDEVDAGVGGAIADAIGEKLQKIAQGRQVLCVTHLAQVAARAHVHLKVEKQVIDGRTFSKVTELARPDRVEELARMLAGRQITELSRRHAEQFLEQAQTEVVL